MLLDEQRPMSTSRGNRCPEVPEVPCQDEGPPGLGDRHHRGVSQIETRRFIPLDELEGPAMLRVRRPIQDMCPVEEGTSEYQSGPRVASSSQDEMNFDVDRPRHNGSRTERG